MDKRSEDGKKLILLLIRLRDDKKIIVKRNKETHPRVVQKNDKKNQAAHKKDMYRTRSKLRRKNVKSSQEI